MAKLPIKGTIPHGRTTANVDIPLKVTDSGGLGVLNVTGGGGGAEYAEDSAHVSGDLGTQVLAVRNDGGSALAGTDGDYIPLSTDSSGALRVTGGGGGVEYTEGDTDASITGSAILWEDSADTLRAVSAAKPLPVGDAGGSLTVDGTVAATQSGTWNVTNVSGTVSLPTGASTLAEQQTQTTSLQLIDDTVGTTSSAVVSKSILAGIRNSAGNQDVFQGQSTNADDIAVSTAGKHVQVAGYNYVYDGTTWDRQYGDATNGTLVNLGANNDVTVTGTVAVTQSGTWDEVGINDSGNSITVDNPVLSVVGGGTEATAQRVTIASDSTGVLSVDDNGSSLTVDYATTGSGTATGALRVELPTNGTGVVGLNAGTNAIGKLVANSGVDIGDVDVTSVIPGTGATNLGKAEDAAHTTGDTGVMALAVRNDAGTVLAGTSGDYIPLTTDNSGNLRTTTNLYLSTGKEVPKLEDVASADGDSGIPFMAVQRATPANSAGTDGDYEFLQMSSGRLWTSAIVTDVVPGTSATSLGKAEDAAHSSGDTGIMALGVRNDTLSTTFAGTTGDYSGIATDSLGAVWTRNVAYTDSGTTLTAINTTYNNTTTTASSADITIPTGARMCDLVMTIDSTLTPTDITFHVEAKDGSTYFRMKNGFLGKFIFDDTAVATAQNLHVTFPCPMTGTMRITVVATGTDATNTFDVTNAKLFFRS